MVSTPLARDYLGRAFVQGPNIHDYLGRDVGAGPSTDPGDETDYLGRSLLPPAGPT